MDAEIAKLLNERFVCVKVDREERPDVDQIYMTALQAFGNGGWPMSMFLTPDGRPFFGGTYFPPKERQGMPGFPTILQGVVEAWRDERPAVEKAADRLAEVVRRSIAGAAPKGRVPVSRAAVAEGRAQLAEQFDPEYGGFGYSAENAAPAQVPRARQPRLPPRPAPPRRLRGRQGRQDAGRDAPRAAGDGPDDDGPDGPRRHPRPAGRGLPSLLDQPVLDRPALREDALRQRRSSPRRTCSPSRPPATRAGGPRPRPPSPSSSGR